MLFNFIFKLFFTGIYLALFFILPMPGYIAKAFNAWRNVTSKNAKTQKSNEFRRDESSSSTWQPACLINILIYLTL